MLEIGSIMTGIKIHFRSFKISEAMRGLGI